MPNFESGTINAEAPARAAVGVTSEEIVPETIGRVGLTVTNLSTQTIYIGINNPAVLNAGITLSGNGGNWSMDEFSWTNQQINAIGHAATLTVAFQQFVR